MEIASRVLAIAMVVTIGCGASGLDDGDSIDGCVECGPGALVDGRFFLGTGRFAANTNGQAARSLGAEGEVQLFDREFRGRDRVPSVGYVSFVDWPIRIDPEGNVAVLNDTAVVFIDARAARIRWQRPLENMRFIATSETLVFVATGGGTGPFELHAFRSDTGAPAWTRAMPAFTSGVVTPDGGLVLAGSFTGTLDLGGDTTPASSASAAGWLGVLDASGVARGRIVVGQGSEAQASITNVAVGANGNIAVVGRWTGGSLNIGTVTLPAAPTGSNGVFAGMIEADGTLQWARAIGTANKLEFARSSLDSSYEVTSLLTDGVDLFISGTYWVNTEEGFAARITRHATAWVSWLSGFSDVDHMRLLALVEPDEIVAAFTWNLDRLAGGSDASWFHYGNHESEVVEADTVHPGSVIGRLRR